MLGIFLYKDQHDSFHQSMKFRLLYMIAKVLEAIIFTTSFGCLSTTLYMNIKWEEQIYLLKKKIAEKATTNDNPKT